MGSQHQEGEIDMGFHPNHGAVSHCYPLAKGKAKGNGVSLGNNRSPEQIPCTAEAGQCKTDTMAFVLFIFLWALGIFYLTGLFICFQREKKRI